jgi:hypothetical protein
VQGKDRYVLGGGGVGGGSSRHHVQDSSGED